MVLLASSTSKLVEKSKLKEIVPSSVLSVHVPFREPSPIVSQTQVREECNDDVSMFWEDPILHHLQNSAEIRIPETQFPETQYSHHEVPTFEEGHFDPNASPYGSSRPLPTLSPPTLPQNLEDTNKVPSSQTVSSVVAKMKPSPKKPKPVTKLNLMREITPPPSPDGIDPHRRPSPGPSRRSLKPIPMMPLALFEPYLRAQGPSQETIEEFSSPKRETRRPTMHKRLVAGE